MMKPVNICCVVSVCDLAADADALAHRVGHVVEDLGEVTAGGLLDRALP